jgi:hypothetical protein
VGKRSRNGDIVQLSSRQFADVVAVAPAGRIGDGKAGERERVPRRLQPGLPPPVPAALDAG